MSKTNLITQIQTKTGAYLANGEIGINRWYSISANHILWLYYKM